MKYTFICIINLLFLQAFTQEKEKYFQQEVNYNISVSLNDTDHTLTGFETIEYTNHSKQALSFIYFHLWPNAYRDYNSALGKQLLEENNTLLYYASNKIKGYIDSLNFKVNGQNINWELDSSNKDICKLELPSPIIPGETITITTPFFVKIPLGIFSRLGHLGQSYQITQWYPKPAVFDADGWHQMPYLDQGEFYSEYGTFDVHITLPENYVIGSTGDLINGEKEIDWLNGKVKKTLEIQTFDLNDMNFPASSSTTKTLHFHQDNVHDFAWFADKRYHVLKGEATLPHSQKKVTLWAMFTNNEAPLWKNSIQYLNDAIHYYSLWNGDYPYNQITAVDGTLSAGGGMEYPNITLIGESYDSFTFETTIIHEVGHNWFYGILGSNERNNGWMDEGINSMNENRYIETKYPNRGLISDGSKKKANKVLKWFDLDKYKYRDTYYLGYLLNARRNKDQAIQEHSANYTPLNYGAIVYGKSALAFTYLKAYLGDETYDQCMRKYFTKWKFKHPKPRDLQLIFEKELNQDLSWFFDDLIKTTNKLDYKITKAKTSFDNPEKLDIMIKNKGDIVGPFSISGIKADSIIRTQWYPGIANKGIITFKNGDFDSYKIDAHKDIPEIKRNNNTLKTKGPLKKTEPFRLQLMGSLDNPDKTQLFIAPIAGWNANDQAMFGLAFYNTTLPAKTLSYVIAPLYAHHSENMNGYFDLNYTILPKSVFREIKLGSNLSSFSFRKVNSKQNNAGFEVLQYYKIAPSINFNFKKKRARQFHSANLLIRNNNIIEEEQLWLRENDGTNRYEIELNHLAINQLVFSLHNLHPVTPFRCAAEILQSKNFIKLNLTTNYHISYRKRKTGFDIRVFAGKFLNNKNPLENSRFNYQLDGNTDFLYEQIFLARTPTIATDGFLTQQFAITDGGFKNRIIAESDNGFVSGNNWIGAINLKSNILTKHISIYSDFGIVGNNQGVNSDLAYNYGIALNIVPKIFEIYFPIKSSSSFNLLSYEEKIRFTLNLNTLNPFKKISELDL